MAARIARLLSREKCRAVRSLSSLRERLSRRLAQRQADKFALACALAQFFKGTRGSGDGRVLDCPLQHDEIGQVVQTESRAGFGQL